MHGGFSGLPGQVCDRNIKDDLVISEIYIGLLFEFLFLTFWGFCVFCCLRFLSQACKLYDSSLTASVNYILSTFFAVVAGELLDSLLQVVLNRNECKSLPGTVDKEWRSGP